MSSNESSHLSTGPHTDATSLNTFSDQPRRPHVPGTPPDNVQQQVPPLNPVSLFGLQVTSNIFTRALANIQSSLINAKGLALPYDVQTGPQERFCHGDDGLPGTVQPRSTVESRPLRLQMPVITELRTGEEQDVELFSERSKLYTFDPETSEWKERATGITKILRCPDGRARVVTRRAGVLNVACNHYIRGEADLRPLAKSKNALMWSALDFADSEGAGNQRVFALRLRDMERLKEFKRIFIEEVDKAKLAEKTKSQRKSIGSSRWPLWRR